MPQNETCIFAKSRSEKKKCSHEKPIKYHRLTEGQLRVAGIAESGVHSYACAYHVNQMCYEKFCCCPISLDHSKFLLKCPKRFYEVFDEEGKTLQSYKPGTMICKKCINTADNYFASHPAYIGPAKRKRVIIMYSI